MGGIYPMVGSKKDKSEVGNPLILVADPRKPNRKLTCDLLRNSGYTVIEVSSSHLVVETARQNNPDLVVIGSSWANGKENNILRKFHQDSQLDHISVIVIINETRKKTNFEAYRTNKDKLLSTEVATLSVIRLIDGFLSKKYTMQ